MGTKSTKANHLSFPLCFSSSRAFSCFHTLGTCAQRVRWSFCHRYFLFQTCKVSPGPCPEAQMVVSTTTSKFLETLEAVEWQFSLLAAAFDSMRPNHHRNKFMKSNWKSENEASSFLRHKMSWFFCVSKFKTMPELCRRCTNPRNCSRPLRSLRSLNISGHLLDLATTQRRSHPRSPWKVHALHGTRLEF